MKALVTVLSLLILAGCEASGTGAAEHAAPVAPVTFNKQIAPIIFARCSPCHHPGQPVPFSLLRYEDVRDRAHTIARVVSRRQMPPWLPEPGYGEFADERRLRPDEIELIQKWVDDGALEGNSTDVPEPPVWNGNWQLGRPDLIVQMPVPFTMRPEGEDVFRNFVLPVNLSKGRFVRAFEFQQGNTSAVHHAVIYLDPTHASRRRDGSDGTPGYSGMPTQSAQPPAGHFVGWTPGRESIATPPGMSWRLERGTDLVVQLHLRATGNTEPVQVAAGLFFTDAPPERVPMMIRLGSKAIAIPAGEKAYAITDNYVLPVDVDILSVYPHAHYLGKQMEALAVLPDGRTQWLIRIKEWDFHWQQDYRFAKPLALPRGTTLKMRYTYDNSDAGSRSHQHQARTVFYGPNSTDEMGDLWLQMLPKSEDDRAVLSRSFLEREARANVAGGETLVGRSPGNADYREFLGSSYLQIGRIPEAIHQFEQALRLNPRHAGAHNMLGGALAISGRTAEGVVHLRAAVALEPADDRLRFNLANALAMAGRAGEAERELRQAIRHNPDFGEAHNNLGVLLLWRNRSREAVASFERALEIEPGNPRARENLDRLLPAPPTMLPPHR